MLMADSPAKAVFLSYASQDAEAARRICDALRADGIEVWFDADGGLEHGDEWDAKIRRQIKECVLFLPLISANTQAREEGPTCRLARRGFTPGSGTRTASLPHWRKPGPRAIRAWRGCVIA